MDESKVSPSFKQLLVQKLKILRLHLSEELGQPLPEDNQDMAIYLILQNFESKVQYLTTINENLESLSINLNGQLLEIVQREQDLKEQNEELQRQFNKLKNKKAHKLINQPNQLKTKQKNWTAEFEEQKYNLWAANQEIFKLKGFLEEYAAKIHKLQVDIDQIKKQNNKIYEQSQKLRQDLENQIENQRKNVDHQRHEKRILLDERQIMESSYCEQLRAARQDALEQIQNRIRIEKERRYEEEKNRDQANAIALSQHQRYLFEMRNLLSDILPMAYEERGQSTQNYIKIAKAKYEKIMSGKEKKTYLEQQKLKNGVTKALLDYHLKNGKK